MFVWFSTGKLGVVTPGCVNEVPDMECGRSEIDELIKEVSGGSISGGLTRLWKPCVLVSVSPSKRCFHPGRDGMGGLGHPCEASLSQLVSHFTWCPLFHCEGWVRAVWLCVSDGPLSSRDFMFKQSEWLSFIIHRLFPCRLSRLQ